MKDYTVYGLSGHDVDEFLFSKLDGQIGYIDIFEGGLQNNYFCDDFNVPISVNGHRVKARKHLYVLANYLNEWSSDLTLVLTDNDKKYYTLKRNYISQYLKDNKAGKFIDVDEKENLRMELLEAVAQLKACK